MPSVTRKKGKWQEKRDVAVARVLEATERLLRDGERFTEISVERLLDEGEISRSTFYIYFRDKSAVLVALAEQAVEDVSKVGESWWLTDHSAGPSTAEPIALALINEYRKYAPVLRALLEVGAYDDQVRELWRLRLDEFNRSVADRMRVAQSEGRIDPDVDVGLTASMVGQLVNTVILDHVLHGSPQHDRDVATAAARIGWLAYYGHVPS